MSLILTQSLAAFSIAGLLADSTVLPDAEFFYGGYTGDGVLEAVDSQREPEGSTELLGEAHGGMRAGEDNPSDEGEFVLSNSVSSSFEVGNTPRERNERRTRRVHDHNRPLYHRSAMEYLVGSDSQLPDEVPASRRFSDTIGNNVRGKAVITALMMLVGALGIAWVAKHISTYRKAAESLHQARGDQQQLLTKVKQSRSMSVDANNRALDEVDKSERPIGDHRSVVEPAGWHADLVAELLSTRNQLAELQRILDTKGWSRTPSKVVPKEASDEAKTVPLSFEQALDEIASLEMELESLKQQRADLSAITKIQDEIRKNAEFLKENVSWTVSVSGDLGEAEVLFRKIVALQEGFMQLGDKSKNTQLEQLKAQLRKTLDCAHETSVWSPAVGELTLLLEEDRLKSELASIRAKVEQQSSVFSKVSQTASLVNSSVQSSIRFFLRAVGLLRPSSKDTPLSMEQREQARARREAERHEEERALASLRSELEALEDFRGVEQRVLRRINTYDRQQYVDWLSRKKWQARTAMDIVIAALSSLPNQAPPSIGDQIASQDVYSVTLESSKNKAVAALNFLK